VRQVLCPVLVGRDEEARHLQAALAAAGAGRGGTVLVTGEAGIGKSRLVRETTRAAGERGFMVLAGRAVAGGVPTPFRPFAEALAAAGRAGRLPEGGDLDPFRPALGRLIPQWRQPQVAGDESLVFLGEALLRLLRALSLEAGGCLLVLEDLHWADGETLALLEYLADNLAAERVLCLGTLRDEDGVVAAALAGVLEVRGSAAVLPLGRLDPAAMARMALACVGGTDLPGAVQSFVAERAEGIPFLVEEVLAGLIGDGTLAERDGRWHATDLAGAGLPDTFADAVHDRLEGLEADSRQVLCAAAVLGRRFDWALLGPVTGQPDTGVVFRRLDLPSAPEIPARGAVGSQTRAIAPVGDATREEAVHRLSTSRKPRRNRPPLLSTSVAHALSASAGGSTSFRRTMCGGGVRFAEGGWPFRVTRRSTSTPAQTPCQNARARAAPL